MFSCINHTLTRSNWQERGRPLRRGGAARAPSLARRKRPAGAAAAGSREPPLTCCHRFSPLTSSHTSCAGRAAMHMHVVCFGVKAAVLSFKHGRNRRGQIPAHSGGKSLLYRVYVRSDEYAYGADGHKRKLLLLGCDVYQVFAIGRRNFF